MFEFNSAAFILIILLIVKTLCQNLNLVDISFGQLYNLGNFDSCCDSQTSKCKYAKLKKLIEVANNSLETVTFGFEPQSWCKAHNPLGPAIFAAATSSTLESKDVQRFVGTLRKTGYIGDIVLVVSNSSRVDFINSLKEYDVIAYNLTQIHSKVKVSIHMQRFYYYQIWSLKYSHDALIMISDFRDVFFQSNPFTYKSQEWNPPKSQCPYNGKWIRQCYGEDNLRKVQSNTVSCSGVSIGTRDAILSYSYLIVKQLDPLIRYGKEINRNNHNLGCLSKDQGFHNWLLYTGQLSEVLDVKIYQQGEGPVNTVSFGKFINISLEQWNVLRGVSPDKYFYNWNGDISPVVHQYDRLLFTEFGGSYENNLAVMKDFKLY